SKNLRIQNILCEYGPKVMREKGGLKLNGTTGDRGVLRDLFQFHLRPDFWVALLLAAVVLGPLVMFVREILYLSPGYVPPGRLVTFTRLAATVVRYRAPEGRNS